MFEMLAQGPLFLISLALLLGLVVIIHELGHYYAARWAGAAIESFSVGFLKPLYERTDRQGTRWRINWLPFGGFVSFVSTEEGLDDIKASGRPITGRAYDQITPFKRIIISLAGPAANFLLAILLFSLYFFFLGEQNYKLYAQSVTPDGPAAIGGMQAGDIILEVNQVPIKGTSDLIALTSMASNTALPFKVLRGDRELDLIIVPERRWRDNGLGQVTPQGTIDIQLMLVEGSLTHHHLPPHKAIWRGSTETLTTLNRTVHMLGRIITGQDPVSMMSGPVAIGDVGRRIVNRTMQVDQSLMKKLESLFWRAVLLCAAVSVGIGFFNLLPLPVLDGGHVVFNAYEIVAGRPLSEKVQEMALMAGLGLLLTLFVFITWGDILETGLFN